jgi:beta-lactamase regulating signal transducer with metallopeptidase domain
VWARLRDLPWRGLLVGAWVCGAVAWASLLAVRVWRFRRVLRLARPAGAKVQGMADDLAQRLGLRSPPAVLLLPARVPPLLWFAGGSARVFLPQGLSGQLDGRGLATVLAHELAHLKRRDHWVRLLELAVLAVYWWHPVVWLAIREIHRAEDACCDAMVVATMPS